MITYDEIAEQIKGACPGARAITVKTSNNCCSSVVDVIVYVDEHGDVDRGVLLDFEDRYGDLCIQVWALQGRDVPQ